MVSKMIWREKHIAGKESRAAEDRAANPGDDTAASVNPADDTFGDEDSEKSEEIDIDMNFNLVFAFPAEFRAPRD